MTVRPPRPPAPAPADPASGAPAPAGPAQGGPAPAAPAPAGTAPIHPAPADAAPAGPAPARPAPADPAHGGPEPAGAASAGHVTAGPALGGPPPAGAASPGPPPGELAPGPVLDTALGLRCRARAKAEGPAPALAELRAGLGPDARAWGPGGHALLPLAAAEAPGGAPVLTLEFASGDLGVWRDESRRDGATGPWTAGVLWIRLGLTEHLLRTAADYLAGRRVGGEVLAEVSSVRTMLGEAAADLVEARLLLEHGAACGGFGGEAQDGPAAGIRPADAGGTEAFAPAAADGPAEPVHFIPPGSAALAADVLVRAQRTALRLLGASGYLDDGPGRLARAVDLLADVHPVTADPATGRHAIEVSP